MDLETIIGKLLQDKVLPIADLIPNQYVQNNIAQLKKDIRLQWEANKPRALELADHLLRLKEEQQWYELPHNLIETQIAELAQQLVAGAGSLNPVVWPDNVTIAVANYLKALVDTYRWRDDEQAIIYARVITKLGQIREDNSLTALGLMAWGDTLTASTDRLQEAWDKLQEAARYYLEDGNMVGWARTCIGRVAICIEFERIEEAVKDVTLAQEIFHRYKEHDLFIRLSINLMRVFNDLGRYGMCQ